MSQSQLRFAALVRVSTEGQEKWGESLRTQTEQIIEAVRQVGGVITEWYKGQEHATPGYERKMFEELLADARGGHFNAVMVADPTRWSRDDLRSSPGLRILREHHVRFFSLTTEYDLYNPDEKLSLRVQTVVGEHNAETQKKKSIENKVNRAKRGLPTCGSLPFGRTYDKVTGEWSVDPDKKALIEEAARRYLQGESLPKLAAELRIDHSTLHEVLTKRSGDVWVQTFRAPDFDINESVPTTIPPLLPPETIQAIRRQCERNRKHVRGHNKHSYLLQGRVFCGGCGRALSPQHNNGSRYYRPARACGCLGGHVRADDLEGVVTAELFVMLGNPALVEEAIKAAQPDTLRAQELEASRREIDDELDRIKRGRAKLLRALEDDLAPEDEVRAKLMKLRDRSRALEDKRDSINSTLANVPTTEQVRLFSQRPRDPFASIRRRALHDFNGMTASDHHELVRSAFEGATVDGSPCGVYIEAVPGAERRRPRPWGYTVRGNLVGEPCGWTGADPRMIAFGPDYVKSSGPSLPPGRIYVMPFQLAGTTRTVILSSPAAGPDRPANNNENTPSATPNARPAVAPTPRRRAG